MADVADLIAAINGLSQEQRHRLFIGLLAVRDTAGPVVPGLMVHPIRAAEAHPVDARKWASAAQLQQSGKLARSASTVKVYLISRANSGLHAADIATRLQRQLERESDLIGLAKKSAFHFAVVPERERRDRRSYGIMDFPVYLTPQSDTAREIFAIAEAHGAPTTLRGVDLQAYVAQNWDGRDGDYGIAIPADPSSGNYAKAAFINETLIRRDAVTGVQQIAANIALHEIFHMTGGLHHSRSGLMKSLPASYMTAPIEFNRTDRIEFFGRLETFRTASLRSDP